MFQIDDTHQELISLYRDFAENTVKPIAADLDKEERFPEETVAQLGELGMLGIPFPEEYGGTGMDNLSYVQCIEELSKVCASTGVTVSAHTSLCAWPIYHFPWLPARSWVRSDLPSRMPEPMRQDRRPPLWTRVITGS